MSSITTDISIHNVARITARSPSTLGAPLILSLTGTDWPCCGSITIFLQDQKLVDAIVEGINKAQKAPDPGHEAAHETFHYQGANR